MELIKPSSLKKGDTIWIISPSAWLCPIFPHRVKAWVSMIEKLWFKVKFAQNSQKNMWYISATIDQRVQDIHEMFLDKDVSAIICSIWWNHSNQLLKYIDLEIIKNNPKIFIWYSDITVLHYAFYSISNLQTFYWPCLISEFWEYPEILDYTKKYFLESVCEKKVINIDKIDYYTDESLNWIEKKDLDRKRELYDIEWFKFLNWWEVKWEIIWGCIPSVNHLIWTKYWIEPDNKVFFIDLPEWHEFGKWLSIEDLDSYLTDLDNIWLFDKISAFIVSTPYWYTAEQKLELEDLILRFTKDKNYPILINFPIWHSDPMLTIAMWSIIELNSKDNKFIINNL